PLRDSVGVHPSLGWLPGLAWHCDEDGSRSYTTGSPLRRSVPAQSSPPSAPRDLAPLECPAAVAVRLVWECTVAAPAAADTFPHGARLAIPTGLQPRLAARSSSASRRRCRQHPCCHARFSMPPAERHSARSGHTAHGNDAPRCAWPRCTAGVGVLALFQWGCWVLRPCPRAYLHTPTRPKQGPFPRPTFRPASTVL